jgi:hypothetical protein
VPRLVIFFPVVGSGSAVRVRRELVEFGGSLVRIVWHAGLPSISCTLSKKVVPFRRFLPGQCPELPVKMPSEGPSFSWLAESMPSNRRGEVRGRFRWKQLLRSFWETV